MLELPDRFVFGEDSKDMKSKGCCEFESWQDEDFIQQPPIFIEAHLLFLMQAIQLFEQFKLFNFLLHLTVTSNGIVISKGDDIHAAGFCPR
jgi:hypothetical protein